MGKRLWNGKRFEEVYKSRHTKKVERLISRDGRKCRYCRRLLEKSEITIDHIKPKAQGGSDAMWNLVIACTACNQTKGQKHLTEFLLGARGSKYATKFLNNIRAQHKSLRYE